MIGRAWHAPILLAAVLAVGSLLVASPGPAAGSSGACPGATGVTVVVDYGALGGGAVIGCAPGSPSSGFKALAGAGFQAAQAGPGFLCRIDGKPGPDTEDCANTPPPTAYWSYWHADRGGHWAYSPWGADHKPAAGSVEGWAFHSGGGAASAPGIPPPPPAPTKTPKPTPKPTAKPTPKPTPKSTAVPTRAPTAGPTQKPTVRPTIEATDPPIPTDSPVPTESPAPSAIAPDPTTSPEPSADASETPGWDGSASPPAEVAVVDGTATSSGGPPIGTLVGVGLVVLVGAGALSARRRRAARDPHDG